jgi:hypothetical protein
MSTSVGGGSEALRRRPLEGVVRAARCGRTVQGRCDRSNRQHEPGLEVCTRWLDVQGAHDRSVQWL